MLHYVKISLLLASVLIGLCLGNSAQPWTHGLPSPFASFDPVDHSANVTISNSSLTVLYSGAVDAAARTASYKTSGLYYFEFTVNSTLTGGDTGGGVAQLGATLGNIANISSQASIVYRSGNIWNNGLSTGLTLGSIATSGTIIGVATNMSNSKNWFRIAPAGNWNGQAIGSQDPVTNTGGVALVVTTGMTPTATFNANGDGFTFNTGGSTFNGAVPSGFTSGWTR
jgi:hypothetical protein